MEGTSRDAGIRAGNGVGGGEEGSIAGDEGGVVGGSLSSKVFVSSWSHLSLVVLDRGCLWIT